MNYKFKTVDLFSGIGGIRRGFEMTGYFENILSAEIDKYACMTYQHLFGENPFNDVTSEQFKHKVSQHRYDVLLAGFPCQAFSRAGKEEGFKDKARGTLFFEIADLLERTRPRAFLLENVDSIITHQKGKTFKTILEILINDLNYHIVGCHENNGTITFDKKSFIRNSRNFGLPQNRPRVYIIGYDKERYANLLEDGLFKCTPDRRDGEKIWENLDELLDYNVDPKYYISQGYLETLKKHKTRHKEQGNGFGYVIANEKEDGVSNAILATGGSGKERNLIKDIQENIPGMIIPNKKTPLNKECIRLMTPDEWAKLQGFMGYGFVEKGIDRFSFPEFISNAQRYKHIG